MKKSDFNIIVKKESSRFHFLFLSILLLESKWIWQMVIMRVFDSRVGTAAQYLIVFLCYAAFVVSISYYFKGAQSNNKDRLFKRFMKAVFALLTAAAMMTIAGHIFSLWSIFAPLTIDGGLMIRVMIIILFGVVFVLSQVVFITGYALLISILKDDTYRSPYMVFTATMRNLSKKKTRAVILFFLISIFSFLMFRIKSPAYAFIDYFSGVSFIGMFFKYAIQSLIAALLLSITNTVLESFDRPETLMKESLRESKLPAIITSLLCVLIVVTNLLFYGAHKSEIENLIKEADLHIKMGDVYRYADMFAHSRNRYDNARFVLLSTEALLDGVKALKDKNKNINVKQLFAKADSMLPENGTTEYFKALLTMDEVGYVEFLLDNQIYVDRYHTVLNYSDKRIDDLLDEIKSREKELDKRDLFIVLDSMWYHEYKSVFELLKKQIALYEKKHGEYVNDYQFYLNSAILAEMCITSEADQKIISEYIMRYFELFDTNTSEEEMIKTLNTVHFLIAAKDFDNAEMILARAMKTYPDQRDLIEKKAEMLYKSERFENLKAFLDEEINVGRPNRLLFMYESLVNINEKNYKEAVISINKAVSISDDKAVDLYVHNFCMSYIDSRKSGYEDIFETEEIDKHPVVYNTLKGAVHWRQKKYEEAGAYFLSALDFSGYPAYLYYFLGMNSYEHANQSESSDFKEAERYYLKAIELEQTNPHFFFSIGYCYKKAGDTEKATAAFNRVLSILPYQDYGKDFYGISGHSKINIRKEIGNR